jgi:hypothetical protein
MGPNGTQNQELLCWRGARSNLTDDSRMGVARLPKSWHRKIWPCIPQDSEPRMTVLARTSSNLPDSQSRETVKYGYESCGSWNQEWLLARTSSNLPDRHTDGHDQTEKYGSWIPQDMKLCWQGPAAIYRTDRHTDKAVRVSWDKKIWSWVPIGPEPKNDCPGGGQQQFTRPGQSEKLEKAGEGQKKITALLRVFTERTRGGPIWKHIKGLGKNRSIIMGPDGARKQNDCVGEDQQQIGALLYSG